VPSSPPPGRGVWTDGMVEVQVALLDPDPAGTTQATAVTTRAADLTDRWAGVPAARLPRRFEPLPTSISGTDADRLRDGPRPAGDAVVTLAVGGDEPAPIDLDLDDLGPSFVIAGPARSGRSTALVAVAATLRRPVVVVAPRPSPLRDLAGRDGVAAVYTSADEAADELGDLLDELACPLAVLVDDAELVTEGRLAVLLEQVVRAARDHGIVVVAAATTDDLIACRFRGWLADARRTRSGLLLCPGSNHDGDAFDLRLPRSLAGGWPPGRGLLVTRGRTQTVQVIECPPVQ
jgi:DNA segregation ATPase FtsK/SpoIIIE, S-DNA-T family